MKKIFFLVYFFALYNIKAQQNYCAESKSKMTLQKTGSYKITSAMPLEDKYDLKFYHLNINVERNSLFISGNVKSTARVTAITLDTFAFVLHQNHIIDSVYVNGINCNFIRQDSLVKAAAGNPILQNQLFDAIVYYHGICPSSVNGSGYIMATPQTWGSFGNECTASLSQSFFAYHWFPCKQDLRDKIDSSWVFATTDSSNMVGSNGLLKNVVTVGDKKRYEWKSQYPIDYYLISVATSKYEAYNLYAKPTYLPNDSILIQNFIYANAINNSAWSQQKASLDAAPQSMELLCSLYGMYPFYKEKYGHCMAAIDGGMEHQTMSTMLSFDVGVNNHELGHQWWGDNVTCASWKDIFINESWATYTSYLCTEYLSGPSAALSEMNGIHSSVMSLPGGSCYFSNADTMNTSVIFDSRLTYGKGAAVIHSLRYVINNDSVFYPAIRAFQNTYRGSTASVIDFKNFMQAYSGINLQQFFNQWYYGEGYPTFSLSWNASGGTFYLVSTQTQSMPASVPLFITPVDYRISRTSLSDTIVRLYHTQAVENYSFALNGNVTSIGVDPQNWILNKVGTNVHNTALAINEEAENDASVFIGPNPTSDALNVYLYGNGKAKMEITDMMGKLILHETIYIHREFDISNLANGIYTVTLKNDKNLIMKKSKIVKN